MSASTHPDVQRVGEIVSGHLGEIAKLFKRGTKITLLARQPDTADGSRDMVLTDDALDAVIAALTIRLDSEARQITAPSGETL